MLGDEPPSAPGRTRQVGPFGWHPTDARSGSAVRG